MKLQIMDFHFINQLLLKYLGKYIFIQAWLVAITCW